MEVISPSGTWEHIYNTTKMLVTYVCITGNLSLHSFDILLRNSERMLSQEETSV
jgi:hypothetical protein